jgi:type IV pilus assembly protein PilV
MRTLANRQSGSFLLEALIAILIVALGVLGSVGLLARSMQDVDDAKNRGEAAYLANMLIGRMWTSDRLTANLTAE